MAFCCASSRFRKIGLKFSRVLCIRRCTGWSTRDGSQANGASRKTNARPNITGSPRRASANYRQKLKTGTAWRMLWRGNLGGSPGEGEKEEAILVWGGGAPAGGPGGGGDGGGAGGPPGGGGGR